MSKEDESFHAAWERFVEATNACPHLGYATWMLLDYFYEGLSLDHMRLVESMRNGSFLSKNRDEVMAYLTQVAKMTKGWEVSQMKGMGRVRPHSGTRGGIY